LTAQEFYSSGNEASGRGDFALAAEQYRRSLELSPDWHEAQHNLASVLYQLGQIDEALELFRTAAAGKDTPFSAGMQAVIIPGAPKANNEDILETREHWGCMITPYAVPAPPRRFRNAAAPSRIGYMCSFFDRENYMKPVWALINRHDRNRFEIHLFSDTARERITTGYQPHASDVFHYTGDLKIEPCAHAIRAAQLDLLIDLNAYSRWRRLPVYGLRPAPVIASWFNSYATTGVRAVDYLIGDETVAPAAEDCFYTEKILRLPGSYLTFELNYPVPDVALPPFRATGHITFGCLAPLYKITPPVIAAWSRILHAAPGTTLLLKNSALASSGNRNFVLRLFAQHGIDPWRLQLEGPADHYHFLEAYSRIDIALDTFPYNGGTTTTEALWQGVPVITFYGDRWASRTSASLLRAGNLKDFVAGDLDGYVEMAAHLASTTPDCFPALRTSMREHLRASCVCDVNRFAREMERLYLQMLTAPESP
jgi:predicted O-linked N-acetylglucosamine transferase (SPINDLY family)